MWYWWLFGIIAAWVLYDGFTRKINPIVWALGTFVLGPIVLPFYFAKRPLKDGEIREGGTGWNVLRNFALAWTLVMAVAAFAGLFNAGEASQGLKSDAEKVGAGLGIVVGMGLLGALWFFPMVGALLLGLFLKKSSIIERGPSGPLVKT